VLKTLVAEPNTEANIWKEEGSLIFLKKKQKSPTIQVVGSGPNRTKMKIARERNLRSIILREEGQNKGAGQIGGLTRRRSKYGDLWKSQKRSQRNSPW